MEKQRWEESEKRREEKRKIKKIKEEKVRRKKMQVREKVGKSRKTAFFQWFVAPEGRKVGSLKRRVRSHLARWEMKNCTPLWREAHVEVKMYKAPPLRSTFRSCDVEKVHAVVARSTCPSQNVQNTPLPDHFWKLTCRKSARRCGRKQISKSKVNKQLRGPEHFWTFRCRFCVVGRRDCAPCQEWTKRKGFVAVSTTMAGVGHLKRIWTDAFRVAGAVQETCSFRYVRRSGRWFPERGCILEHQIFSFGKMILCDRCSTLCDLASLFRGRRNALDRWSGKIAKRIGTRPSALPSTFQEVSQNCFVFEIANFKNWGSLPKLLRFDVVKFKNWGRLAE